MSNVLPADRIVGMMPTLQLAWLGEKALSHSRIAEIGCWRGRTTKVLCDNTPGTVTAIDTWNGSPGLMEELGFLREVSGDPDWLWHEFLHNLEGTPNLEVVRMGSVRAAEHLSSQSRTFDMIFLDGLHDYYNVCADIHAWFPLLESPGLLCGHDFLFPGVRQAVEDSIPGFPRDWPGDFWAAVR